MDVTKIQQVIELLKDSDITELCITEGEESLKVSRGSQAKVVSAVNVAQQPLPTIFSQGTEEKSKENVISGHRVLSPMVGTFYRSPSPDAKPYAEVGQTVAAGDTLCIIEAMKMMNPIESDKNGVIKSILIDNGQPVEFDQPLFIIE